MPGSRDFGSRPKTMADAERLNKQIAIDKAKQLKQLIEAMIEVRGANDAPIHYSSGEAHAWYNGYSFALAELLERLETQ